MAKTVIVALTLLSAWLLPMQGKAAPSFDCTKATQVAEKLICRSDDLSDLDERLAALFADAKKILEPAKAHNLVTSEREWLRQNNDTCRLQEAGSDDEKTKCLIDRYKLRMAALRKPVAQADLVLVDTSPDAADLCHSILSGETIVWNGLTIYDDLFEIEIPKSVARPHWKEAREIRAPTTVEEAQFDLTNDGKQEAVYRVKVGGPQFGCCGSNFEYYLPLAKSEVRHLGALLNKESEDWPPLGGLQPSKAASITYSTPQNHLDTVFFSYRVPGIRSAVYAVESVYTGADNVDTGAELVLSREGAAYILDRRGMALFRPNPKGTFDKVCYRKTVHSFERETLTAIDPRFPCPNKQRPLDDPFHGKDLAMITLAEWGGTRPVLKGSDWTSRVTGMPWIQIGAIGAEKVSREDNSAWEALQKLKEHPDSRITNLLLSDLGPYVEVYEGDDYDSITTYHRIVSGDLIAACSVEYKRLPPPGIRSSSDD